MGAFTVIFWGLVAFFILIAIGCITISVVILTICYIINTIVSQFNNRKN
jgi:hypothetical protein